MVVRRFLSDAVRWKMLVANPALDIETPQRRPQELSTWSASQVNRFLAHVEGDRLYALWHLAVTTGMRRGELIGLRWEDLILDAGEVRVSRSLVSVEYEVVESPTKSGESRTIALAPADSPNA
jgi:integrase